MTLVLGAGAYALVGIVFGASAWRRSLDQSLEARAGTVLLATVLWPLWAPFVGHASPRRRSDDALLDAIARARSACHEASMDGVFTQGMADRLAHDVLRARARIDALGKALDGLGAEAQSGDASDLARLEARHVTRLRVLRDAEQRSLEELGQLLRALHAQLVVARFAGPSEADVSDIVREVWSRVEGLGAVIAPDTEDAMPTSERAPTREGAPSAEQRVVGS